MIKNSWFRSSLFWEASLFLGASSFYVSFSYLRSSSIIVNYCCTEGLCIKNFQYKFSSVVTMSLYTFYNVGRHPALHKIRPISKKINEILRFQNFETIVLPIPTKIAINQFLRYMIHLLDSFLFFVHSLIIFSNFSLDDQFWKKK